MRSARGILWRHATIQTAPISASAISTPGTTPARNSCATDTPVIDEYSTKGIEGGNTGPMVDDAAVIAAEKSGS